MLFSELGLPETIVQAAAAAGYSQATTIQADAIPVLLAGHDLIGCSQTGTGKTAAFAMPLLAQVDLAQASPQILVLTPTRELAIQVAEAFEQYGQGLSKLRVLAVYGGASYQPQLTALRRGVHVVVGTPGRLIDHIKSGALSLETVRALVLDEADEMLRMGFIDDVQWVLSQVPQQRQIALFSATMPGPIRQIADQHLRQPHSITVDQTRKSADTIRQQHMVVYPKNKVETLCRLLEVESTDGVIVFVKTKLGTVELADRLIARGFQATALNGDIPQAQRQRAVEKLKAGEIDILVATDVAARGLDVDRISHVINYDLPHDQEAYVHRIGRTGRAGRQGAAILMVSPSQRHVVRSLQRAAGTEIEAISQPSVELINQRRADRFKEQITAALESRQINTMTSLVQQYCEGTERPAAEVAAALAVMAIQDRRFFAHPIEEPNLPPAGKAARGERREFPERREFSERRREEGDFSRGRDHATREHDAPARGGRAPFARDREDGHGHRDSAHRGHAARGGDGIQRYRLEVGRIHGAQPGNLVGAIANESGLAGSDIGRIDMFDHFTIVSLPADLPPQVLQSIGRTWVAGRQLRLSPDTHPAGRGDDGGKRPFRSKTPFGGGRPPAAGRGAPRPFVAKSAAAKGSTAPGKFGKKKKVWKKAALGE